MAESNYRRLGRASAWDVNKRTISRYLEASVWQPQLNGVPIAEAILATIRWRIAYPIPVRDKELLVKGLQTGTFIVHKDVSKVGWPIVYVLVHNDKLYNAKINATCLLYTMERAIQNLPPEKQEFILFIDARGFGFQNAPTVAVISEMSEVLYCCCICVFR